MNQKNLSNITFAWGSLLFGSIGMNLLGEKDYILGTIFVSLSLIVLFIREKFKID